MQATFIPSILDEFDDVQIATPVNNQVLKYDSASGKWKNADYTEILSLTGLSDVVITTPASGQVLRHNGTNWVNVQLAHSDLSGTGTNTHAQIDSHLASASSPHGATLTQQNLITNVLQVSNGNIGSAGSGGETVHIDGYLNTPLISVGEFQDYLTRSEDFGNATWVKTNIGAVTGSATDPMGTTSAQNIPAGTISTASLSQAITDATTGNWTFSVYLRMQSGTATISLRIDSSAETGTAKSIDLTTAWKRYSVTQNFVSANTAKTVYIISGTNAISAYGAQLEPTSVPRVYGSHGASPGSPVTTLQRLARIRGNLEAVGITGTGALTMSTSGLTFAFNSAGTSIGRPGLITTSADGYAATNSTAATSGVPVQMSPRLRLSGNVWDTGAVASRSVNFKNEVLPISGNPGVARLLWGYDYNAGGYTELMSITSGGAFDVSSIAPSMTLTDTTASAKSLKIDVDADVAQIREKAGVANSLISFNLSNNRIGVFTPPSADLGVATFSISKTQSTTDPVTFFQIDTINALNRDLIGSGTIVRGTNGTMSTLRSGYFSAYALGATITQMTNLLFDSTVVGGSVVRGHGLDIDPTTLFAAGTIADVISIRCGRQTVGSSKNYGFYYGADARGAEPAGNFAVYADLDKSFFGGNVGFGTIDQFGSGAKVIGIANATTVPTTNPTGGGVFYCEAGALKYRGSSGTVTQLAPA